MARAPDAAADGGPVTRRAPRLGALASRNFRLFFLGQLVSAAGIWLQQIAETWLVLDLTGSAAAVGLVTGARFLPILFGGIWGGVLADRYDKRRLLYITQSTRGAAAGALAILVFTDRTSLAAVYACALVSGIANAVDNPARRAFIGELVERDQVLSAVSLNSSIMATSRVIAPLLAGAAIATVGVGWCFAVNAISYGALLFALRAMDERAIHRHPRLDRARGAVRAAFRYAREDQVVFVPLVLVAVVSTFAWNWETLLAVHATETFGGGAPTYATLFASVSAGTLFGALVNARRRDVHPGQLARLTVVQGALTGVVALLPGIVATVVALFAVGLAAALFTTSSNAVLQAFARPEFHGRVMAMYSMLFIGTKGIGGIVTGLVSASLGPRSGIGIGAVACVAAGWWAQRRPGWAGERATAAPAPA